MRYKEYAVARRNAEQRNEADNRRDADLPAGQPDANDPADQRQRQIQHDDARHRQAAELLEQQQKDNEQRNDRHKRQHPRRGLLALELAAVFDMVSFGQIDLLPDHFLDIAHHAMQVAVGHVGRYDDLALCVLAADRIRPRGRYDIGHVTERHFTGRPVDRQIPDTLHVGSIGIVHLDRYVERTPLVVDLRNDFAAQRHLDES